MSIDLRILEDDLTTEVAVLDVDSARHGLEWVDSILDQGGGNFKIPHNSPAIIANPGLFAEGNVIQIREDSTPLFAFEIERPRRDAGDVSDRISVAGPGALALLDHALVYAPREQEALRNRQRVFGWMSTDFDDTGWDSPIDHSGGTQGNPDLSVRDGHPEEWPDPDAEWIWSEAVDGNGTHPVGNVYFRRTLDVDNTVDAAGPARIFITADNRFVAYFDGEQVATGRDWRGFATIDVDLVPSVEHVLAVEVRNTPGGNPNPGGLLVSIVKVFDTEDDEELGQILYRSFTGTGGFPHPWKVLGYPGQVPGVTHGFVLKTLFDEAQARGSLNALSIDFDEHVDSSGDPWTDEVEVTTQVGNDTVLTVADRMRDWPIEFRMHPGTFTWQAFQRAGTDRGGTPDSGASTVTVDIAKAAGRTWEADGKRYDLLLVETQFAWAEVKDSPPVTNRHEGFLSLAQSPTLSLALQQAEKVRQRYATRREQVTFRTSSGVAAVPHVYDDYHPGDVVVAPTLAEVTDQEWALGDLRVDTVAIQMAAGGHLVATHQAVDARLTSTLEKLLTTREALGDGTLQGRTKISTSPIGDGAGRQVAQATRRGGGGEGAADPRTITVELADVEVPVGGLLLPWQRLTSLLHLVRMDPPANDDPTILPVPAEAVWLPRLELEWHPDELVPVASGYVQQYAFRGGGEVDLKVNGLHVWPVSDGSTSPTPEAEGIHRRFESVLPALYLDKDDQVEVAVDHGDAQPRTLARALLTLTLVEPFDQPADADDAPSTEDVDTIGGNPEAACPNGPNLWVRFRGGDDDAENMLADYLDGDGNLCAPTALHFGEPFIVDADGPYGDASFRTDSGGFSGDQNYTRSALDSVASFITRVRLDPMTGTPETGWIIAPTGGPGVGSSELYSLGMRRDRNLGVNVRFRRTNYPVSMAVSDPGYTMIGVTIEGTLAEPRLLVFKDGKLVHDVLTDPTTQGELNPSRWRFFTGVDTQGVSLVATRFTGLAEAVAWPWGRRLTRQQLLGAMTNLAREGRID